MPDLQPLLQRSSTPITLRAPAMMAFSFQEPVPNLLRPRSLAVAPSFPDWDTVPAYLGWWPTHRSLPYPLGSRMPLPKSVSPVLLLFKPSLATACLRSQHAQRRASPIQAQDTREVASTVAGMREQDVNWDKGSKNRRDPGTLQPPVTSVSLNEVLIPSLTAILLSLGSDIQEGKWQVEPW